MKVQLKALFVATSLFVVGAATPTYAQDVATGVKYLDAEQFNKAKETFSALANTAPSAENQFYLGYYNLRLAANALRLEKPDQAKAAGLEAKAAFEKASAADPKFTLGFVGLGGVALLNKDLAGAKALKANGNFIVGGAMLDDNEKMIGSVMILQFENDEKMQEWYDNEPYITQGVWKSIEIKPFRVANV